MTDATRAFQIHYNLTMAPFFIREIAEATAEVQTLRVHLESLDPREVQTRIETLKSTIWNCRYNLRGPLFQSDVLNRECTLLEASYDRLCHVVKSSMTAAPAPAPAPAPTVVEEPRVEATCIVRAPGGGIKIPESLDALAGEWNVNRQEQREIARKRGTADKEREARNEALRTLNMDIYDRVKQERRCETPVDFIWFLKNKRILWWPIPIMGESRDLEGGQVYKVVARPGGYPAPPPRLEKGVLKDTGCSGSGFRYGVRRNGNQLLLFIDSRSSRSLDDAFINGKPLSEFRACGETRPTYIFQEGDVLTESTRHIFTVGKNGGIHVQDEERHRHPCDDWAIGQSRRFEEELQGERTPHSRKFTSCTQAAELGFDEPLESGFSFYSSLKPSDDAELLYIDIVRDPVLQSLVSYLTKEFEVMKYTDKQKIVRLGMIASDLFQQSTSQNKKKGNYLLGEVARAGAGVCRHRALLIKALAPHFDIRCALVAGIVPIPTEMEDGKGEFAGYVNMFKGGHVWNVVEIDGELWILDANFQLAFPFKEPPGIAPSEREVIADFYGIKDRS